MSQTYPSPNSDMVRWAGGLNILAGIWLIISPFILGFSNVQSAMWNAVIVGIVVAVLAAIRAGAMLDQPWLSWINLILGIWLFVSPWVLGYSGTTSALWNSLVLGVIVFVLSGWSILSSPDGVGSLTHHRV